jgi:hypothetical protein
MQSILLRPIYIQLKPSNLLLGLLTCISIICCMIVLSMHIPMIIQLVIIALIILTSICFILRDALLHFSTSWKTVEVDHKGVLIITNQRGQQFQPTLAGSCFIHTHLIILNFKRTGFRLCLSPVILLLGADNADELRRLRVWLRWSKHFDNY